MMSWQIMIGLDFLFLIFGFVAIGIYVRKLPKENTYGKEKKSNE